MTRFLLYKANEQITCYQPSVTVIKNAMAEDSHKTQNVYYIHKIWLQHVSAGIGHLQVLQNN